MNIHEEMKRWLLSCFEEEYDQETIQSLTYDQCVRAVNRYYDGGYKAFLCDFEVTP